MMPGNNDSSTSLGEDAANSDTDNSEAVNAHSASDVDASESLKAQGTADGAPETKVDPTEPPLHENADPEDPLGFGDHRMDADAGVDSDDGDENGLSLQARLDEAEAKASENWDRLLRLQAEMENQRKRAQNDVNKARKFALESIVGDLLPVKDSLEMGLAAASTEDTDPKSIVEGAELTLKMLAQVFEKNNIIEVNPVDEKFDPEFHQAMSMQQVEGKDPNTVTSVMQKGYTLNDRLVRPALVMVAK